MRKQKKIANLPFIIILMALAIITGSALNKMYAENNVKNISPILQQTSALVLEDTPISKLFDTRELILVNSENLVAGEDDEFETIPAFNTIAVSKATLQLQPCTLDAMEKWFAAAKEQGYDGLYVTSGYRDYAYQKELYEEAADKSYVQLPGASEHHTGLAVDVALMDTALNQLDKRPEGKWLIDTAKEYGFILRYTADKKSITKISYEPWHFRYVGLPHSYLITENDLCLEEYMDLLKEGKKYSIDIDETQYTVYYTKPTNDTIQTPRDMVYSVSSDNTKDGGYIITVEDKSF